MGFALGYDRHRDKARDRWDETATEHGSPAIGVALSVCPAIRLSRVHGLVPRSRGRLADCGASATGRFRQLISLHSATIAHNFGRQIEWYARASVKSFGKRQERHDAGGRYFPSGRAGAVTLGAPQGSFDMLMVGHPRLTLRPPLWPHVLLCRQRPRARFPDLQPSPRPRRVIPSVAWDPVQMRHGCHLKPL